MTTLTNLFIFLGFYTLYSSSKRAALNNSKIDLWIQQRYKPLKLTGVFLLLIGLGLSILTEGFATGTFLWFIVLMTLGSLVILLTPLKLMNYKTLLVVFVCTLVIENFII